MRRLWAGVVLCCVVSLPAVAQEKTARTRWIRRLTLAATCAASFWDASSTAAAVAAGARERNGLFADRYGNPQWGRLLGVKAGLCGGAAVVQEFGWLGRGRAADLVWTTANSAMAAAYTAVAIRNGRLAADLKRTGP